MTMGQRIRQARLEAGLSQRELAGEAITRNMLSGLEHDSAAPSLGTLRYLSERLGKKISWFLGEEGPSEAVTALRAGEYRRCRELLEGAEKEWLEPVVLLFEAEQALIDGRIPYARELLQKLEGRTSPLFGPASVRHAALLRAKCGLPADVPADEALLLKADAAVAEGRFDYARRYLNAVDRREGDWHHRMGECAFRAGDYAAAKDHYHRCEAEFDVRARLEVCYRELEDYKMAYFYAKK